MTNPVQMYGGGDRATSGNNGGTMPASTARDSVDSDDIAMVPQNTYGGPDPLADQTTIDPEIFTSHVADVMGAAHESRQAVHYANVDQLGSSHVGAHEFPTNDGH